MEADRVGGEHSAPDSPEVARAVEILLDGGLVAFPTETVYGLGADASNAEAVASIYRTKGRPPNIPLIVHLACAEAAVEWSAALPPAFSRLAAAFWPGPLALVVFASPRARAVTAGLPTVALRVPRHPLALRLLRAFGGGLAAPSANRYGRVSPTTADDVRQDLGPDSPFILDGGACEVGVESTVLDLSTEPPTLLRKGAVTRQHIEEVLGQGIDEGSEGGAGPHRSPGLSTSHYAPRARVELHGPADAAGHCIALATTAESWGFIGPRSAAPPGLDNGRLVVLSDEPDAYARGIYAALREADRRGWSRVLVVPPDEAGLGAAVRDRLSRAARR